MDKDMVKRVVITGIGPVTSLGIGKEDFYANLLKGRTPVSPIPERFKRYHLFKSQYYIPFPFYTLEQYGFPKKYNRILQNEDSLALLGTKLALEDAGLYPTKESDHFDAPLPKDCAIIIGIGMTSLDSAFSSHLAHLKLKHPESVKKGRFNRMIIPMMMSNSPAAWVSILFGIKGPAHTINASCASGTIAIGNAFQEIQEGRSTIAITGGVESLVDDDGAIMRGFDMLGTLTTSDDGLSLPFSEERCGFLFAEGGGSILVLEELEHALKRDAEIYAEITNFAENCDAFNIVQIDDSGEGIEHLIKTVTRDEKINYYNSHGTGTLLNDATELKIVQKLFPYDPAVNSTKGLIGHTIGASGAIEAAVTALSIKNRTVHGNTFQTPLHDLNLIHQTQELHISNALSVSFGFGGHNAGLLLKRFEK